jgi:hypothetical protein
MSAKSLPFSNPLVPKVMSGEKTQTRRLRGLDSLNRDPGRGWFLGMEDEFAVISDSIPDDPVPIRIRCPYGKVGSKLWVKEQLRGDGKPGNRRAGIVRYGADGEMVLVCSSCGSARCENGGLCPSARMDVVWDWKPKVLGAMYCPRWASRIALEITDLRVEHLQEITIEDAWAEGFAWRGEPTDYAQAHVETFFGAWDALNRKKAPVASNPWVWVVEFKRVD